MSVKQLILDEIVTPEADDSELEAVRSDEDESFMQLDGDAFRLDKPNPQNENNGKALFVNDDSLSMDTPVKSGTGLLPEISPSKRVQFNVDGNFETGQETDDLWDFNTLVQQEFRRRLPQNYEVRGWKKPSRNLVSSLESIFESNMGIALEQCFTKYEGECERVILDRSLRSIHEEKEQMLFELLDQIKRRISKTRFPSRCADRDLDIEYIYAKRQFMQSRFSQESARVEALQLQVQREQTKLDELKTLRSKTTERNARKFKQLTDRISANLHPALSKAMINSFGLLRDGQANTERYQHDVDDLNLRLQDADSPVPPSQLQDNLSAIKNYQEVLQSFKDIQTGALKDPGT
ncbi:Okp1p LALA0_S06e03378g [Lachancea lanzarotensis]|uniref:LALA0S06e03378g1_1 n=1 Tax=Lachancea lanzarotensis TaxID=1245769 RepID=A0A0C7MS36_9SACH|nr:uncharacterized protein LALA0_S06e03378g [Lachancea lanzarotensis]CEP62769.1 LALA0S06e03378g1_1 [Lachancea lanzarotensis]